MRDADDPDDPRAADADDGRNAAVDHDVVVVGGGPAGCAAGVFAGRYGLDACVFDRGPSSLRRCAFLENYLGFPAGIDVDAFYGLIHDHAREAGCELVGEPVTAVRRNTPTSPFVVESRDGRRLTATYVIAATRSGGDYLRPLDDGAMFLTAERDGEPIEYVDPDYADADGRTPIDGLYVASPTGDRDRQAITAAGHGGHVARTLVEDRRRDRGYPEPVADYWDWVRRAAELPDGERRAHWRERFDDRVPDDRAVDDDRLAELREADVDRLSRDYRTPDEIERLTRRGYDRLLDRVPDDCIRAYLDGADDAR